MQLIADIRKTFASGFRIEAELRVEGDSAIVILFGPSGAGKTTILRCLAGLEPVETGRFLFNGQDWTRVPPQHRPFGYVFQDFNLLPGLTAAENVSLPLELDGMSMRKAHLAALAALERRRGHGR